MYILLRLPELKWTLNDNETVTAQADYYSTPINALMVSSRTFRKAFSCLGPSCPDTDAL